MKILLAKPIIETKKRVHTVHPLSLGYLASALRQENDVTILDCEKLGYNSDDFRNYIKKNKPDFIGITVFSHNKNMVQESVSIIRETIPDVFIVLGGPHINARRKKIFEEFSNINYAIQGEAEQSIRLLVDMIENKNDKCCKDIPGLIFKDAKGIIQEIPNQYSEDISRFDPMPYDLLDIKSYFGGAPQGFFYCHREIVSIITSRGCPYPCTFCAGSVNNGKKIRYRKIENVIEEIQLLIGKYHVREIHILDDNFTFSKKYALLLCRKIIELRFNVKFALPNGIRLDKIDDELLGTMREAGFYSISFGIESGSDETLLKIKKLETTSFIRKQLSLVKKHGFRITGTFIIGFPWEAKEDVMETLRFAKSLPLDHAAFGNYTPLPATQLTDDLIRSGSLKEDYDVPFTWGDITYSPPNITKKELKSLQRKCVLNFYLPWRIHLVIRHLGLSNLFPFARRVFLLLTTK